MNLGMFVAFLFFFYGFYISKGSTLSNGFISCLGSKTIFLVFALGEELISLYAIKFYEFLTMSSSILPGTLIFYCSWDIIHNIY